MEKVSISKEDAVVFLKDIADSIKKEKAIDFKLFYKKEEHTQLIVAAYVRALEIAINALEDK